MSSSSIAATLDPTALTFAVATPMTASPTAPARPDRAGAARTHEPRPAGVDPADAELVDRLLAGDEDAFTALVEQHHSGLMRLVRMYVRSDAMAQDVLQETWMAVLKGLPRFERRSSLKTWISRIAANRARTRAVRDGRMIPFSNTREAEGFGDGGGDRPAVAEPFQAALASSERSLPWSPAGAGPAGPEDRLLDSETLAVLRAKLEDLPPRQRTVVELRDLEGWTSEEVCEALDLTEANQRVLLHRGRTKLRAALQAHLDGG